MNNEKKTFQVGDRVTLKADLTSRQAQELDDTRCGWHDVMKDFQGVSGTVTDVTERGNCRINFDTGSISLWFCPAWLEPAGEKDGQEVPVSDLEKIHAIACSKWKTKIEAMVPSPFAKTVFVTGEMIRTMIKVSNEQQRPVVQEVFQEYLKSKGELRRYFNFGEEHTMNLNADEPMYICYGMASSTEMQYKEIGFSSLMVPILVDKGTGEETVLDSDRHFLKFQLPQ